MGENVRQGAGGGGDRGKAAGGGAARRLVCAKCGVELEPARVGFEYLGHVFHAEAPKCPKCGQAFVPEEMARGRMAEVEAALEDK